jgi:predicted nucleic acid-binding protein
MGGSQRAFVDTNVLAYALDTADVVKMERAHHLLETHASALVISTQVLIELYSVCVTKLGIDAHDAAATVRAAARLDVVPADRTLILDSVAIAADNGLSVFDAAIVCAAMRAECDVLFSEDLALSAVYVGIEFVNPFVG